MRQSCSAVPRFARSLTLFALAAGALAGPAAEAGEWPSWRGPWQNGRSDEKGIVTQWSPSGENLIWRLDWSGRSTPVVFDGRVCANGRAGENELRQEAIACWDAETGKQLWQRNFTVYQTQVPWNRVGWASLVADVETGNVYAQLVHGTIVALDREGKTVWEWRAAEDFNRQSGYGGRTNTPIVDGDLLIAQTIAAAWGQNAGMADRYVALDKRTGAIRWVSTKGDKPQDLSIYSTPVIAEIDGERLLIGGGSDGFIHAVRVHTGEEVWRFHLSQRGLNSSPVVHDGIVYAGHSEENVDTLNVMGRLVAINARGAKGDVTKTHELWRVDDLDGGYASPLYWDGKVFMPDNGANLWAFDAKTGTLLWKNKFGTVGKGSPVAIGGKLYVTEVNGHLVVMNPADGEIVSKVQATMPDGRYAELYGSVAPAYGRLYFTTEEGLYCVGDKKAKFDWQANRKEAKGIDRVGFAEIADPQAAAGAKAAKLLVVPSVVVGSGKDPVDFKVFAFDDKGRPLGEQKGAAFAVKGLPGSITPEGRLTFEDAKIRGTQHGQVEATLGELKAAADLRIAGPLPWSDDFEGLDKAPAGYLGGSPNKGVKDLDGSKVFFLPKPPGGAPRATTYIGPSSMKGYTLQADVRGTAEGRRITDVGIIVNGYTVALLGAYQQIQVDNWESERRMMRQFPFAWQQGIWYTLKARVDYEKDAKGGQKGVIRAKVWKRGEAEPAEWTVTVEDPLPPDSGSPGLYGFVPVDAYFDNVSVTAN